MKSAAAVTFKEFTSDGRTGENSLIGRQILKRLRKIAANFGGNRDTEFVDVYKRQVLSKGVGHLEGTSLPVGGQDTHTVLTGHTGLDQARLLSDLNEIEEGDVFCIYVLGAQSLKHISG